MDESDKLSSSVGQNIPPDHDFCADDCEATAGNELPRRGCAVAVYRISIGYTNPTSLQFHCIRVSGFGLLKMRFFLVLGVPQ